MARKKGALSRLREICLALPEATEKLAWESPTFRVHDKIFAMYQDNHHNDGELAMWCKLPAGAQEVLIGANPARFFKPPYVGQKGWVGVRLNEGVVDWNEAESLLEESYRLIAPKRLAAQLVTIRKGTDHDRTA